MDNSALTLPERLRKYGVHVLIVLPALLLLLVFKFLPFIDNVKMAFSDYSPWRGIWASPWTGFANFKALFDLPEFGSIFANTLILKIGYTLVCGLLALGISLSLAGIRSKKLRNGLASLFLIPYFIPSLVFAYVVMILLSPSAAPIVPVHTLLLADSYAFRPIVIVAEAVKTCGIPIAIALAAVGADRAKAGYARGAFVPAARAIAAFMLLQLSTLLASDFELLFPLVNPLVYSVGDTLDTYGFRVGVNMGDVKAHAVVFLLQFIIQLALTVLAYLLVRNYFFRDVLPSGRAPSEAAPKEGVGVSAQGRGLGSLLVPALYALVALMPLYLLFVYPFLPSSAGHAALPIGTIFEGRRFVVHLVLCAFASVLSMAVVLTLAYPLTAKNLPGRSLYRALLLFAAAIGGFSMTEYLVVGQMGMRGIMGSQVVCGLFPVVGVFVLKSIFNGRYGAAKEQASFTGAGELRLFFTLYIPKIWKPLAALGALQFTVLWNAYIPSLLYFNDPQQYSPVAALLNIMQEVTSPGGTLSHQAVLLYAGIVSIPPIVLFLALRRLITSEVLLGQIRKL